jgi:Uncharacterised nucleotidyltransferase
MAEHIESLITGMRPEAKLLLNCSRTQMDAVNAEQIVTLLQREIDWSYLLQMATRHKLSPLLYRSIEAVAPAALPENVRGELKNHIQVGVQGNLFLTKVLLDLLDIFTQHSIFVIPYKGPVLAASVYRDLALRPCNDLDILVHEQDILMAMDVLASCGYEIIRPSHVSRVEKGLQSTLVNQLVESSLWAYQLVLWHPEREVLIELHWRILPKYIFSISPEQLWADLQPVTLGGTTVSSFSPENLLWFLCVHGTKHHWTRLGWLCDVSELIREYPQLNWEQVIYQAKTSGIERRLYLGLLLASRMLGMALPEVIEAKIQTTTNVIGLAQQVTKNVFDDSEEIVQFSYLDRFAFQLRAMDRIADRGRYLFRFINGFEIVSKAKQASA